MPHRWKPGSGYPNPSGLNPSGIVTERHVAIINGFRLPSRPTAYPSREQGWKT